MEQEAVWQMRRYCSGDDVFTEWTDISDEEYLKRKADSSFSFRRKPIKEETKVMDAFLHHEVLHTASLMEDMFDRHIVEHRAVEQSPVLKEAAAKASQALHDFYQLVSKQPYKN